MQDSRKTQRSQELRIFGMPVLRLISKRQARAGVLLFVAFLAATRISGALLVAPALIFPAAGIAIGGLFLESVFLWPFVYLAALTGYFLDGAPLLSLLLMPVAYTLMAVSGTVILKRIGVDPILRRSRDMFSIILVALTVSIIPPTTGLIIRWLNADWFDIVPSTVTWFSWWVGLMLSILILTPFVLRWFAKPHFTRTFPQVAEIIATVGGVTLITYFLYWTEYVAISGISLTYALFLPLFWVALRLGPRFLTLSLVLMSVTALSGVYIGIGDTTLGERILQTELFLNVMAIIFFIVVTIEEERRVASKLLTTQIDSLHTALDQLAEQDEAKNEFIAVVAHELRNPLAPIMASLDLLKEREQDKENRETLDFMESCMLTVRRLLDDLLDVSRAHKNRLTFEESVVNLTAVVQKASASRQHTLKERTQSLTLVVPETPVMVCGDSVRLEQIVMNLLVNASKFTDVGGRIAVTLSVENTTARIEVSDSGVGIAPEMLEHIFEPFAQVEQGARSRKGLGIGLALVRQLTEMHTGHVRAKSKGIGHGSTFIVELPLLIDQERVSTQKLTQEKNESASRGLVLIVDDNDAAAYSIGRLLELKGYSVEYAYDGTHAMERVFELMPDSVLLDIGLPDIDGFAVARAIRAEGYQGNLIALTGYSSEEDRARAKEVGFNHHLIKPVGMADLRRVL